MHALNLGSGEFSVMEDLVSGILTVNVRSLSELSGDGLALLQRQLNMLSNFDGKIVISIPRAEGAATSEAFNLGAIAQICCRLTKQNLIVKQLDTGVERMVRVVPG